MIFISFEQNGVRRLKNLLKLMSEYSQKNLKESDKIKVLKKVDNITTKNSVTSLKHLYL